LQSKFEEKKKHRISFKFNLVCCNWSQFSLYPCSSSNWNRWWNNLLLRFGFLRWW